MNQTLHVTLLLLHHAQVSCDGRGDCVRFERGGLVSLAWLETTSPGLGLTGTEQNAQHQ